MADCELAVADEAAEQGFAGVWVGVELPTER